MGRNLFFRRRGHRTATDRKGRGRGAGRTEAGNIDISPVTTSLRPGRVIDPVGVQTQGTDNGGHMVLGRQRTRYGRYLRTGDRADRLRPAAESVL